MYSVSSEYKEIMNRHIRNRGYMIVSIGIINNEAQSNGKCTGDFAEWSNPNFPLLDRQITGEYATYEQNQFKADGSLFLLPENVKSGYIANRGLATNDILGKIRVQFTEPYDIKGLTLDFGEFYPTSFKVKTNAKEKTYNNNQKVFTTEDVFTATEYVDIIPISMIGGQQRLRLNRFLCGVGISFTDDNITNATIKEIVSSVAEEIPSNTFTVNVFDENNVFNVDDDNSYINFLETGQRVNVSVGLEMDNESVEYLEMGNYSLTDWKSTNGAMSFTANNLLSFMDEKYLDGNYIHTRTLYDDAIAVLESAGFEADEYQLDECLKDVTITNPLPEVSQAECLQLIANAGRCILYQNRSGQIVIKANFETVLDPDDFIVRSDTNADWSKPHNIMRGTDIVYVDYTDNFFSADGSMYLLPNSSNSDLATAFVSREVADMYGNFENAPNIEIQMPAGFTYYSIRLKFDGNPPQETKIQTYYNNNLLETLVFDDLQKNNIISHEFKKFDKIKLIFPKGAPNDRVLLNKFAFGDLSDYTLRIEDMTEKPIGYREKKTKTVDVKVFTFQNDEQGKPKQVEDTVYYSKAINPQGQTVTFENQLVSTQSHAQDIAEWLGNYYANNVAYDVTYRGEPRLNASDIIHMESEILSNLQVEIDECDFTYNGAFSGSLSLRRALKMMN